MTRRLRWLLPVAWWALAGVTLPGEQARDLDAGNAAFRRQDYQKAAEAYGRALQRQPNDARALFGRAAAEYRMKRYDEALRDNQQAAERAQADPKAAQDTAARARYNAGNSLYRLKRFDEAARQYEGALQDDPADTWAKHNLEMALRARKQQQPPQGGQGKDKPDKGDKGQPPPPAGGQEQPKPQQAQAGQGQQPPPPPESGGQTKGQNGQPQPPPQGGQGNLTPQQASDLLRDMAQDESDLHRALGRNQRAPQRAVEKDW